MNCDTGMWCLYCIIVYFSLILTLLNPEGGGNILKWRINTIDSWTHGFYSFCNKAYRKFEFRWIPYIVVHIKPRYPRITDYLLVFIHTTHHVEEYHLIIRQYPGIYDASILRKDYNAPSTRDCKLSNFIRGILNIA